MLFLQLCSRVLLCLKRKKSLQFQSTKVLVILYTNVRSAFSSLSSKFSNLINSNVPKYDVLCNPYKLLVNLRCTFTILSISHKRFRLHITLMYFTRKRKNLCLCMKNFAGTDVYRNERFWKLFHNG